MTSDLKFHKQCVEQCERANRILGFIFKHLEFKSKDIILRLYKSLVHPLLEYAVFKISAQNNENDSRHAIDNV